MLYRYKITPPNWMKWGLDTLGLVANTPDYKLTREMRKNEEAAPAGNRGHGLAEIYKIISKQEHAGHHRGVEDARACAAIASDEQLWLRRFNKTGGIFDLVKEMEGKEAKCKASQERKW